MTRRELPTEGSRRESLTRSAKMEERIWRVIGDEPGGRRIWLYKRLEDAQWRARQHDRAGTLIEFSYADITWKPSFGWREESA